MQVTLATTLKIEAESLPEAATVVAPLLEDINQYLGEGYELVLSAEED